MEIETSILTIIGTISIVIMSIPLYYGMALKTRIPEELASLNLIVYALILMVFRRIFHVFTDLDIFWFVHIIDDIISVIIAVLMLLAFKRMYSNLREEDHS